MKAEGTITLKGEALICALDSGICPKTENGTDVGPFLRFWMLFEPCLKKHLDQVTDGSEDVWKVFNQKRY